jgi:hypothetical protein
LPFLSHFSISQPEPVLQRMPVDDITSHFHLILRYWASIRFIKSFFGLEVMSDADLKLPGRIALKNGRLEISSSEYSHHQQKQ